MIKRSVLQENKTLLNVYATNKTASEYMRQELVEIQGETDESTIILIVQDFNTPLLELLNSKSVRIQKNNTVN